MKELPHVLTPLTLPHALPDLMGIRVGELRKMAAFWNIPGAAKLPLLPLRDAVELAWKDAASGRSVAASLKPDARATLGVFRRHGGAVHGEVLRLDLLARSVLQFKETPTTYGRPHRRWTHNPVEPLAERGALLSLQSGYNFFSSYYSASQVDQPFPSYRLHPALAKWVEPAGPPPWPGPPPAKGPIEALPSAPPAQTVLYLRRLAGQLATQVNAKITKRGALAAPSLKTLVKAVPLPEDPDFPLPDPQGLGVELLRAAGALDTDEDGRLVIDPNAAASLFERPAVHQAWAWVRGWVHSRGWLDGRGVDALDDSSSRNPLSERQVLAWYLTALAGQKEPWIDLEAFLDVVYQAHAGFGWSSWGVEGWNPDLPAARDKEKKNGEERQKAYWLDREGRWWANALMITLPWLGVVERGRRTAGNASPWCFRLTPLGKAVFAAPQAVAAPSEPDEPFLVVQPNFDVVAYLDHAGVVPAATLGCLTESDPRKTPAPGPVQTVRLTPASVYLALENGMDQGQIIAFLQRYARNDLPANILQSLREWSARRDAIAVQSGVDLLAFPSSEEAARYAVANGGALLGDRVVRLDRKGLARVGAIAHMVDHARPVKGNWIVDEEGLIVCVDVPDMVQSARLWRIAESTPAGWRLTRNSIAGAVKAGLKVDLISNWIQEHLARPLPAILEQALYAWAGKPPSAALADAVVLQVPGTEEFEAVLHSERFRPYLLHSPGPGWLLVRREKRKELRSLLAEMGFDVQGEFALLEREAGSEE